MIPDLIRRKTSDLLLNYKLYLMLVIITLLGLTLRIYNLGEVPSGNTIDEVNFAYIAKSLIETGRDEHGVAWPLVFQAFNDQKMPFQAYVLIPFIKIFGLTPWSVRLPSALFGTLSIVLIYFLSRQFKLSRSIGVGLSFLWAVSPMTYFLSRIGYESNLALTCFLIGLIGILMLRNIAISKSGKRISWFPIILTSLGMSFSWYCYVAYRPIIVAILLVLSVYWLIYLRSIRQNMIIAIILMSLLILPSLFFTGIHTNLARIKQTNIFENASASLMVNEKRTFCESSGVAYQLCYFLWNKPVFYFQKIAQAYLSVYSSDFLIFSGESDYYNDAFLNTADYGQFNLVMFFLFGAGIFSLFTKHWNNRFKQRDLFILLLLGLLLTPLPAILASSPQKVRLTPLIPFLFLLAGLGIEYTWTRYEKMTNEGIKKFLRISGFVACSYFCFVTLQYFVYYFTIYPYKYDFELNVRAKKFSEFISQYDLENVPVLFNVSYPDPIMYYAFYSNYDTAKFQKNAVWGDIDSVGFLHTKSLENLATTNESLNNLLSINNLMTGLYISDKNIDEILILIPKNIYPDESPIIYTATSLKSSFVHGYIIDIEKYYPYWKSWHDSQIQLSKADIDQ